jgi:hypothetical protein
MKERREIRRRESEGRQKMNKKHFISSSIYYLKKLDEQKIENNNFW